MMSTRSTLPVLNVLVMVLLVDTPRSAAQVDTYDPPSTPRPPPSTPEPPPPLSTSGPPPPPSTSGPPPPPSTSGPPPPPSTSGPPPPPSTSGPPPPLSTSGPPPDSPTVPQVWNASRYPATDFRSEVTPPMFALWPENLSYVKFEYYCEDTSNSTRRLEDFIYKEGLGLLVTRPYFDVGLVDKHFTPYFRHWQFWQVDIKRITCVLHCEYSDLQRLYHYRLKRNVLERGLGYGVAALSIVQVAVMAFTAVLLMCSQSTQQQIRIPSASKSIFRSKIYHFLHTWKSETPWSGCICDWIHLLLLVVIGFAMMEGVGHSDYFRWRSMLLYNTAVTYTYLTLFSMISLFLHQCAHFLTRLSFTVPVLPMNTTPAAAEAESGLSEDWRYQRIFGQFGVMVLMGIYLIGVDDDQGQGMDSLGGIVVAAIVVACIWSAGVSGVVTVRSVRVIFRYLLPRAWKLGSFFDSRIHALPASPQPASLQPASPQPASPQPASPQPASNVSTAKPVPQVSRTKTM